MTQQDHDLPDGVREALGIAGSALQRFDGVLAGLTDGDLHRAHFDGGWTVAEVISHINLAAILWLGNLRRLEHDPDLRFFFREEIGHDVTGYPPPTIALAREQLAATRRSLATSAAALSKDLLAREVEIPDLGTLTVEQWYPAIIGHASGHVDQAMDILTNRKALLEGSISEGA